MIEQKRTYSQLYTYISINVVHEQSGKVEYECEKTAGNR
jgi:hypothetical protein